MIPKGPESNRRAWRRYREWRRAQRESAEKGRWIAEKNDREIVYEAIGRLEMERIRLEMGGIDDLVYDMVRVT